MMAQRSHRVCSHIVCIETTSFDSNRCTSGTSTTRVASMDHMLMINCPVTNSNWTIRLCYRFALKFVAMDSVCGMKNDIQNYEDIQSETLDAICVDETHRNISSFSNGFELLHIVHRSDNGKFSYVQYSQAHFSVSSSFSHLPTKVSLILHKRK